jgi:signal transduction histidine kinase
MRAATAVRTVVAAPLRRTAWREALYLIVGLPVSAVGFALVVPLLALGAALTISVVGTFVGLLVLAAALQVARGFGAVHRWLATLIDEPVDRPVAYPRGHGVLGRLETRLRDGTGWRCVAYLLAKLPLAAFGGYVVVAFWIGGLVNLGWPLWWLMFRNHPAGVRLDPAPVITPVTLVNLHVGIATYPGTFLVATIGALTLLLAPWVTGAVVVADRWLIRDLLGPPPLAQRVRDLLETRALAVDDSAALLRRLERDLHDGAQARLVALAMSLDMAREKLGEGGRPLDAARARELVDNAHRNATQAISELRDLARGMHPPVLDNGLPDALTSLAARSALPVTVSTDLPVRPTPAIETIAYFCAAELLTNVIKHSAARRATIEASEPSGVLRLRVTDDGVGGAAPGPGSGLAGLAQRVRTVDGHLEIASPPGGPTVVTIRLPLRA